MLPLRDSVPFPETLMPAGGRPGALDQARERRARRQPDARDGGRQDPESEEPGPGRRLPRGRGRRGVADAQGAGRHAADPRARRASASSSRSSSPPSRTWWRASSEAPDEIEPSPELEALHRNVQTTFSRIIEEVPYLPEELQIAVANLDDPVGARAHDRRRAADQDRGEAAAARGAQRARSGCGCSPRSWPASSSWSRSARASSRRSSPRWTTASASTCCASSSRRSRRSSARWTRRRPRPRSCASSSRRRSLPEHALKQAERELQRFERLPPQSVEHGVIRTYLEWLATLPWSKSSEDNLDLKTRAQVLDRDHYDIERVKDRILEFLAVRKLKPDARSSILCFVGPAGRGQDLARPLDRRRHGALVRAHLGGRRARRVRDPRPPAHLHRRDARHDRPRACATPGRTTRS